jgi:hypothetical protein
MPPVSSLLYAVCLSWMAPATSGEASVDTRASVEAEAGSEAGTKAEPTPPRPVPAPGWIRGLEPQRNLWEVGAFGGAFFAHRVHDLYDLDTLPHQRLSIVSPAAGLRAAFYPLAFVGLEAEYSGAWSRVREGNEPAFVYGVRGHAILQLPMFRVVPFLLGGYGALGVRSTLDAVGSDIDPAGHWGAGVKLFVVRHLALRLEGRHILTAAAQQKNVVASHGEVQFGVSVPLGWWTLRDPQGSKSQGSKSQGSKSQGSK